MMHEVDEVTAAWRTHFNAKNWDALVALYDADALFYGSTPELFRGPSAIAGYFYHLPDSIRAERYDTPAWAAVTQDVVVTAGPVRFFVGDKALDFRMTWTLVRRADGWRIAAHHACPASGMPV
jgi:ketosteroid isomerase-like protein